MLHCEWIGAPRTHRPRGILSQGQKKKPSGPVYDFTLSVPDKSRFCSCRNAFEWHAGR